MPHLEVNLVSIIAGSIPDLTVLKYYNDSDIYNGPDNL